MRRSLALSAVLIVLPTAWAHAQNREAQCIRLRDEFSAGEELQDILRTELTSLGARLAHSGEAQGCTSVHLDRLSDDVAVIKVERRAPRIADLSSISPTLRARSLALTLAEELNSYHSDLPPLRLPVDPDAAASHVIVEPPAATTTPSPDPAPTEGTPTEGPSNQEVTVGLTVEGSVPYVFVSNQALVGGRVGVELDLGLGPLVGRFRGGLEGTYHGKRIPPFGRFDAVLLGAYAGWRWGISLDSVVSFALVPELGVGALSANGEAGSGATLNPSDAVTMYLRTSLATYARFRLTPVLALDVGAVFGGAPVPARVLRREEVVGGISGFYVEGRVGLLLWL